MRRIKVLYRPVLVQLNVGDDNVAGVNADGDGRTVRLITLDAVDMDHPFFTVHLGDLALPTLILASYDQDLIVLANR